MLEKVKREVITMLARVRIRNEDEVAAHGSSRPPAHARQQALQMQFQHPELGGLGADEEAGRHGHGRIACRPAKSAATIRARAAAARNSSNVMDC